MAPGIASPVGATLTSPSPTSCVPNVPRRLTPPAAGQGPPIPDQFVPSKRETLLEPSRTLATSWPFHHAMAPTPALVPTPTRCHCVPSQRPTPGTESTPAFEKAPA